MSAVEMDCFQSSPPTDGVELSIDHTLEWGWEIGADHRAFHYDFYTYVFRRGDAVLSGRCYRDDIDKVSLVGPHRQKADGEHVSVKDEVLSTAAIRYFVEREFGTITRLGHDGYEPVDTTPYRPARAAQ